MRELNFLKLQKKIGLHILTQIITTAQFVFRQKKKKGHA